VSYYYNPQGMWVFVTPEDYADISGSALTTAMANLKAAHITGLVMSVTSSSDRTNYQTWSADALNTGLGIAAYAAPLSTDDFSTFWGNIHTWQNNDLATDQHPALKTGPVQSAGQPHCFLTV
jgi:hypothetical protein